ncbi:MAG TPA: TonB-dependent receptor [Steroidobacteraceae bacterium]|jgi:outer membrane receptor protein involved in Fe transport|nr:TonB-dependent receptor [Steroidobacteraceae bacterium]
MQNAQLSFSIERTVLRLAMVALLPLAVLVAPAPVLAAAASGEAGEQELTEIVVSAEKRNSTVQETPISLSALSASDLQNQNITTLEDLAAAVPGVSMRTAGPGQTEYEMRGLTSAGGSTATVGFYIDETPLSASAVALNGRTVIDPDLFDLNHVEVLRGPQGTLYGAGSMGGTIKLVTNQPELGKYDAAADLNTSYTESGGSWNGGGSVMLNVPIGDVAALRVVGTDKYISGWLDRVVIPDFPFPTGPFGNPGTPSECVYYYCNRGDVQDATPSKTITGANLERFTSGRAALLLKPSEQLSVTTNLMYQRIEADGYNNYQATGTSPSPYPTNPGVYQPYDIEEPYYDSFKMASLDVVYDFGPVTVTFAPAYWKRYVFQSTDSTEALQNINNLTAFLPSLYVEEDGTTQDSFELRFASNGTGAFQWQGGVYGADLHSGYVTFNENTPYATALSCGVPTAANPVGGNCPASEQYNPNSVLRYPDATLPPYPSSQAANPNGVIFNDNNPNIMKQVAVFGETSYKLLDDLKATVGVRFFRYTIANHADQAGLGTAAANQDHTLLDVHQSGSAVLPKVNLSYTPTPDLTLYGTVAKGSRPGGVNLPIPIPTLQQLVANPNAYNCNIPLANQLNPALPVPAGSYLSQQPQYGPDSVWSFELGEKARFDDRRFTVNADAYYIKWSKIQQVVSLTCGYPYDTNAGDARAFGPEVETSTRITEQLTFDVSGAYTNAKINDPSPAAQAAGFYPGIDVINVPEYTVVASLDFHRPVTDKLTGMFHLSSSLVGPIQDQAYYRETLPSHNTLDLRTGVFSEKWGAYIVGTNLTNKLAALTIDNTVFAWQQPTITRVSTNQPRTLGIDVTYKY